MTIFLDTYVCALYLLTKRAINQLIEWSVQLSGINQVSDDAAIIWNFGPNTRHERLSCQFVIV